MALSSGEQYLLELINRARLDPLGEAARYGITLNNGLAEGQLGAQARQVLAPNAQLEAAAIGHSQWMLATDVFSHTGSNNTTPGNRATSAGYSWSTYGENISWRGTTGTIDLSASIADHHRGLFLSPGHRVNIMSDSFREIGLAQERGGFATNGTTYDASMLTELFGRSGSKVMLTGVAYTDTDQNNFYSIGEGRSGVSFTAQGLTATTAAAGGYSVALTAGTAVAVQGTVGSRLFSVTVDLSLGNVKLDLVNGNTLLSSGSVTLNSGISNTSLLGTAALSAVGNSSANVIVGNAGANYLAGHYGADKIYGGDGNDRLSGSQGADTLSGGNGKDWLDGGISNDTMSGGADRDVFVFRDNFGRDTVSDFSVAAVERLYFDDALWAGTTLSAAQIVSQFATVVAGSVQFEFSPTEIVVLSGVTSTAGLAGLIQII